MALQHLRSSTANKRPTPAAMSDGQLAMNTNLASPGLFLKDSNGDLVKVGPVHVGTTAPNATPASGGQAGNSVGEQWLDTSSSRYVFKIWDGTAWRTEDGEFVNSSGDTMTGALVMDNQQQVRFRETTANGTNFIAIQAPASVTADRTLTLPDVTGTLVSTGDTGTVTSTMIADGTIVNADVNASAAIAGTKISPDFGSQNAVTTGTNTAASFIPTSSTVPTNGVYLPAANSVGVATNGAGRLFVNSTGFAGIGTSSPQARLEIARLGSNFPITGIDGNVGLLITPGGGTSTSGGLINCVGGDTGIAGLHFGTASSPNTGRIFQDNSTLDLRFSTNSNERLRITSAGLVGIGVSSPSVLLQSQQTSAGASVIGASVVNNSVTAGTGVILDLTPSTAGPGVRGAQIEAVNTDGLNEISLALKTSSGGNLPATRLHITPAGRVGIGTTSPSAQLEVKSSGTSSETVAAFGNGAISAGLQVTTNGNLDWGFNALNARNLTFSTNQLERARIDSSGRLLVGTSSAYSVPTADGALRAPGLQRAAATFADSAISAVLFNTSASGGASLSLGRSNTTSIGSQALAANNDVTGSVHFSASDGVAQVRTATIFSAVDGTPGANDMPGRLVFSTTADGASSPTERMRIGNNGAVRIDSTVDDPGSSSNASVAGFGHLSNTLYLSKSGAEALHINRFTSDGNAVVFRRTGTQVGTISVTTTATAYNTSSDYRLKENVVDLDGAIDRLKQLPVHRFNFIADPDTVVDGFIAHEAAEVVPEAVTGAKDEVDDDGNPVYQGIDQSKLVPLLTAALQEAIGRIETLEQRLAAAGID